ncbi:MAG: hypothetical protein AB1757_04275 [Acidobacteriota bacterium]
MAATFNHFHQRIAGLTKLLELIRKVHSQRMRRIFRLYPQHPPHPLGIQIDIKPVGDFQPTTDFNLAINCR